MIFAFSPDMKLGSGINSVIMALGGVCALFCVLLSWQLWTKGQETGSLLDRNLAPALRLGQAREATGQAIFWAREYGVVGQPHQLVKARRHAATADSLQSGSEARLKWLQALDETAVSMQSHQELTALLGVLSEKFREKARLFLAAETRWQTYENTLPGVTSKTRQARNDRITTVSQVVLTVNESLATPAESDKPRIPSLLRPMQTLDSLPKIIDKGKLADVRAALDDLELLSVQWPESSRNLLTANNQLAQTSSHWLAEAENRVAENLKDVQTAGHDWTQSSRKAALLLLLGAGVVMLLAGVAIIGARRVFGTPLQNVTQDLDRDLKALEPVGHRLAQASNAIGCDGESLGIELKGLAQLMGELNESLVLHDQAANTSVQAMSDIGQDAAAASDNLDQLNLDMAGLQETAAKTETIVTTINDIAAQTSKLADDAAREASQTGQASTGLAAVVEEVRSLAARCSAAAAESNQLIEESRKRTSATMDSATKTAEILNHLDEVALQAGNQTRALAASAGSHSHQSRQLCQGVDNTWQIAYRTLSTARAAASSTTPLLTHLADLNQLSEKLSRLDFQKTD